MYRFFRRSCGFAAAQFSQHPRHVVSQCAHGLKPFRILRGLARITPVHTVPVLRRHDGHVENGEVFVQPVKRGGGPSTPADHDGGRRLILCKLPAGIEQAVEQGAQASGRPAKINRRTDDDAIRFSQSVTQSQVCFVAENANAFFLTLITADTTLYWTVADVHYHGINTFFSQCPHHFRKCGERVPTAQRAPVYEQHFQPFFPVCLFHNHKTVPPSSGPVWGVCASLSDSDCLPAVIPRGLIVPFFDVAKAGRALIPPIHRLRKDAPKSTEPPAMRITCCRQDNTHRRILNPFYGKGGDAAA